MPDGTQAVEAVASHASFRIMNGTPGTCQASPLDGAQLRWFAALVPGLTSSPSNTAFWVFCRVWCYPWYRETAVAWQPPGHGR